MDAFRHRLDNQIVSKSKLNKHCFEFFSRLHSLGQEGINTRDKLANFLAAGVRNWLPALLEEIETKTIDDWDDEIRTKAQRLNSLLNTLENNSKDLEKGSLPSEKQQELFKLIVEYRAEDLKWKEEDYINKT